MIVRTDEAARDDLLPIGIAGFARLRRAVPRDQPIAYSDVEFATDNLALDLRRQQDAYFAAERELASTVASSR